MPRQRDPRRDEAFQIYKEYKGNISLAKIVQKLSTADSPISVSTVRNWKLNDNWDNIQKNNQSLISNAERSVQKKYVAVNPEHKNVQLKFTKMNAKSAGDGLNEQQRLFCEYFVRSFNATRSYMKAYGIGYNSASTCGSRLLMNHYVRAEIERLKEIKKQSLFAGEADLVELHMRIAFADITDYIEFGSENRPLKKSGSSAQSNNTQSNEDNSPAEQRSFVRLHNSAEVDGGIISEVSEGRCGVKIKLVNRQESLAFLERFFEANPMDRHKKAYDNARLELQRERTENLSSTDEIDDWVSGINNADDDT